MNCTGWSSLSANRLASAPRCEARRARGVGGGCGPRDQQPARHHFQHAEDAALEPDPERGESLQAIIRQANRIAAAASGFMHFARPPSPKPHTFDANGLNLIREDFQTIAVEKGICLEVADGLSDSWVQADQQQLRRALGAVVQNGIEAASDRGWVRVSQERIVEAVVTFTVEDSGPGLTPEAAEHAFDPFFCGRTAGRGRGLGLATAWRLARQNGGDLRFDPTARPVTRFILTATARGA